MIDPEIYPWAEHVPSWRLRLLQIAIALLIAFAMVGGFTAAVMLVRWW